MSVINEALRQGVPLPELGRKVKVWCFRSLPRPFSGLGPATVSSHKWSRRPIWIKRILADPAYGDPNNDQVSESGHI